MIEIICKDEPGKTVQDKGETVFLPKNIRQVGSPRGRHRIYLEDYVYTYLRGAAKNNETCAAVFLGKSRVVKDIRYTFVSGVVECSAAVFQWENICLDESFWDYIYKEQKQYFSELEIVGWVLGKAGQAMELTPAVEAAHRKYFAGRDKVLMLIDILEGEELFFIYEQGYLQKREGYYIYYEKNLAMQEYMIYKKEEEMRLAKLKSNEAGRRDNFDEAEISLQEEIAESEEDTKNEDIRAIELAGHGDGHDRMFTESAEGQGREPAVQADSQGRKSAANNDQQAMGLTQDADGQAVDTAEDAEEQEGPAIKTGQWQDAHPIPKEPKTQAEEALETYRRMLLERQGRREERQNRRFLYTAASFFLMVLCVIGITTINNYRKMQEVEDVLNIMNYGGGQKPSGKEPSENESLVVESVESQIEPLDNADAQEGGEDSAAGGADGKSQDVSGSADAGKNDNAGETSANEEEKAAGNPSGGKEDGADSADGANVGKADASDGTKDNEERDSDDGKGEPADTSDEMDKPANADSAGQSDTRQMVVERDGDKRYYTVQAGDTLNTICLGIYHSKDMVQALKEVNGIEDGDKILVGQKLLLP